MRHILVTVLLCTITLAGCGAGGVLQTHPDAGLASPVGDAAPSLDLRDAPDAGPPTATPVDGAAQPADAGQEPDQGVVVPGPDVLLVVVPDAPDEADAGADDAAPADAATADAERDAGSSETATDAATPRDATPARDAAPPRDAIACGPAAQTCGDTCCDTLARWSCQSPAGAPVCCLNLGPSCDTGVCPAPMHCAEFGGFHWCCPGL